MITTEVTDGAATIVLSGAGDHNFLSLQDLNDLGRIFLELNDDPSVSAIIVTGAGETAFSAGADLGTIGTSMSAVAGPVKVPMPYSLKGIASYKPVIAAVNGYALGAGFEIMMGADIRISAPHSQFAVPELKWGAIPVGGSITRLMNEVPRSWALRLLLTGERLSAELALQIGLITEIVSGTSVLARAIELARLIARNSPAAVGAVKEITEHVKAAQNGYGYSLEQLYGDRVAHSQDAEEGILAFQQRREPQYARLLRTGSEPRIDTSDGQPT